MKLVVLLFLAAMFGSANYAQADETYLTCRTENGYSVDMYHRASLTYVATMISTPEGQQVFFENTSVTEDSASGSTPNDPWGHDGYQFKIVQDSSSGDYYLDLYAYDRTGNTWRNGVALLSHEPCGEVTGKLPEPTDINWPR